VVPPQAPATVSTIEIVAPGITAGNLTIDSSNGNPVPPGGLSYGGGGGLVKTGSGSAYLSSGTNSYTGATTISAGALVVGTSNAIPDGGSLIVSSGAILKFDTSPAGAPGAATIGTRAVFAAAQAEASTAKASLIPAYGAVWQQTRSPRETAYASVFSSTVGSSAPSLAIAVTPSLALPQPAEGPAPQGVRLGSFAPAGDLGASAMQRPGGSSTAKQIASDLAALLQTVKTPDDSDQHRKKEIAILALEAVFSQYRG
jgi:autotransporter-associated beta strand protein